MRYVVIFCLVHCVFFMSAQNVAYKVLAVKGKVETKENGVWTSLKSGSKILEHHMVRLAPHAYVGLLHKSGKPVELVQPGNYTSKDLHKLLASEKSVLEKYTSFLLAERNENKNRLAATGAVHRGSQDIIVLLPEENVTALGPNLTFLWKTSKPIGPYEIVFSDMFGNLIFTKEELKESTSISLDSGQLAKYSVFSIKVRSLADKNLESDEYYIKRISGEEKRLMQQELRELQESFGGKETPLTVLLEASFFENRKLPVEAIGTIYDFTKKNEDGKILLEPLNDLLLRYGHGTDE